jgi:hypothetical protein
MKKLIENWKRYSEQDRAIDTALDHSAVEKELKTKKTKEALSGLILKVIKNVKEELPSLSDNIVAQAVRDVLDTMKDIGGDISKLGQDIASDAKDAFKEVHAIEVPEDDLEEEDSNTDEDR